MIEMFDLQKILKILNDWGVDQWDIQAEKKELKLSCFYDDLDKYYATLDAIQEIDEYIEKEDLPLLTYISPDFDEFEEHRDNYNNGIDVEIIIKRKVDHVFKKYKDEPLPEILLVKRRILNDN